jgi:uncharacterized membrane protein
LALKARNEIIALVGLILLLVVITALTSTLWPKSQEKFIELGVLGSDKKAEGYFVNDNPKLEVNTQVDWYIYVHSHMTNSQSIIVRVKLLNATMQSANDTANEPSPYASIFELPESLPVNGTLLIPFTWNIVDAFLQNDSIIIKSLTVNGQTVNVDVPAVSNSSFNMIFELWVYDQASQDYKFGWESGKGFFSASVSMWFSLRQPLG